MFAIFSFRYFKIVKFEGEGVYFEHKRVRLNIVLKSHFATPCIWRLDCRFLFDYDKQRDKTQISRQLMMSYKLYVLYILIKKVSKLNIFPRLLNHYLYVFIIQQQSIEYHLVHFIIYYIKITFYYSTRYITMPQRGSDNMRLQWIQRYIIFIIIK